MSLSTDQRATQLMNRADELATHTEDSGIIHRPYGTKSLLAARDLLQTWMSEAGMTTRVDAIGNLTGRYEATSGGENNPILMLGGHFDTVRDAGRYDGPLGILIAISAVAHLNENGTRLSHPIEVAAFVDEEGLRFKSTFLASSPLAGLWDDAWLDYADSQSVTLREAMVEFGAEPEKIAGLRRQPGEILAFIETHIEQGPVLEAADLPVAVVSGITGANRAEIEFRGMAGHAGTVPMHLRKDALAAMAELILIIEQVARSNPDGLVATIGKLDIEPGGPNVIAGRTVALLDLRHPIPTTREAGYEAIQAAAEEIANRRDLDLTWTPIPGFLETPSDPHLMDVLGNAIAAEGIESTAIASGAGHDAVAIANIAPVVMLFVRCKGGISHNPAESVDVADVEVAIRVLDRFVRDIAG